MQESAILELDNMKQGDTLAITTALLPIVFPQMLHRFLAYITYDWDFHTAQHPDGPTPFAPQSYIFY